MPTPKPGIVSRLRTLAAAKTALATDQFRHLSCRLRGHELMLQFEPGKLSLRCHECGVETPGWDVAVAPPAAPLRASRAVATFGVRRPVTPVDSSDRQAA